MPYLQIGEVTPGSFFLRLNSTRLTICSKLVLAKFEGSEPTRIIDRCLERQRTDGADFGNEHESPTELLAPDNCDRQLVQPEIFLPQRRAPEVCNRSVRRSVDHPLPTRGSAP